MNDKPIVPAQRRTDAIDINDFVFAATGARVRRLTLPDGEHWFPAVDLCRNLGYVNTRQAVLVHVPEEARLTLETLARSVYRGDTSHNLAGHGLKRSMRMVNLQGLVRLVNGSTKPESEPFKRWVTDVILTVQREGSYSLPGKQPADEPVDPAPTDRLVDAIAGLEHAHRASHRTLDRIADSLAAIADRMPVPGTASPTPVPVPTRRQVLAEWQARVPLGDDAWAVAAYILPLLLEEGQLTASLERISAATGLPRQRVNACLGMLMRNGCIRQAGLISPHGDPLYVLVRPQAWLSQA
ncbi:BRO-N domain-containing protein [Wenjunlia tyrosinilytica]|uniref:DNA-binding protein n=1 Tax=Wenjunlia tyrosinilytica TaxID=1544741 RepID=A0A918DWU7_9ACTN|nr:Bro-N domain-containing protein [Wenjunlia tyrosinilytica]GGO86271.1 DNA-binding protein [Wenjunlia tyrosinilytica]